MNEQERNMQNRTEVQSMLRWRPELVFVGKGSIYSVEEKRNDTYLVGGSSWHRREVPFSPELARNEPGILYSLVRDGSDIISTEDNAVQFPSMVNVVVPLQNGKIIVGCKHEQETWNLLDRNLTKERVSDDPFGHGVYNALYDEQTRSLVSATRSGRLVFTDSETLQAYLAVPLAQNNTRLWSLADVGNGRYACGDYDGNVYVVGNSGETQKIFAASNPENVEHEYVQYKPSVFGLLANGEHIIAGNRWGQIQWFDAETLKLSKSAVIPYEITYLFESHGELIIGTRQGKLLSIVDNNGSLRLDLICSISPVLQHDNSIWSIFENQDKSLLVGFADGQVLKVNFLKGGDLHVTN